VPIYQTQIQRQTYLITIHMLQLATCDDIIGVCAPAQ